MRKFKLISVLSVILIAMLSVCTISYAQTYNDTNEVNALLKKIGIITEAEYNPEAEITRIDYLKWVVRAVKCDENSYTGSARQIFYDISADDENAPLVNMCYDLGIITGHSDGRFCPNDNIKINEAVIMAMRAAGAGELIKNSGSWIQAAITLDMLDKITVEEGSAINGTTAERVIFNMLNAGLPQSDDGKTWYIDKDTSVLEMNHKLERTTGIVDANSYGNLYGGKKTLENQVSIDGNLYELDAEFDGLFLGENVVYYYEKDRYTGDRQRVVYMCSGRNEILDMDIETAESLNSLSFKYFDENDKKEDIEISPLASTLVNGIKTAVPAGGYTLPKYGSIKLIDNNNDSEFDVILITEVEMRVINAFTNNVIYFTSTPASNMKLEEYSKVVIKNKDGGILGTDALVSGALLEIAAASDKTYAEIVVLNEVVTLTIKGMEETWSNGYLVYNITDDAGNTYRTARDFESISPDNELIMGASHNIILNSNGYLSAIAGDITGDTMQYGYLLKAYENAPYGEGNVFIRILTAESTVVEYPVKKKVSNLSTGTTISSSNILSLCANKQVIRYAISSEGEFSKIEFASNDANSDGFKKGPTAPLKSDSSVGTYYARYYSATSLIGPNIPVDKNTLMFLLPAEGDEEDYSQYAVIKKANMVNQMYYYGMESYMYGDDFYAKALVTSISITTSVTKTDPRMLVSSVTDVYDEADGTIKKSLVGYVDGVEKSYILDDADTLNWDTTVNSATVTRTVGEGDVIRFNVDHNGKLTSIVPVFDYDLEELTESPDISSSQEKDYNTAAVHIRGTMAMKRDNAFFSVIRDGMTADDVSSSYIYPITKAVTFIYEYDSEQKRGQRIKNITIQEVMTLEDDPALQDKVVMVTRDYQVPIMVIYK